MRALPEVEDARYAAPEDAFAISLRPGADAAGVLGAIEDLGYEPELVAAPGARAVPVDRVAQPTSAALREGLARAGARGVPLLVVASGSFCRLAAELEETLRDDERVADALRAFEVVRFDVEADPDAARDLDLRAVPALRVLGAAGRVLARHDGCPEAGALLAFLRGAAGG